MRHVLLQCTSFPPRKNVPVCFFPLGARRLQARGVTAHHQNITRLPSTRRPLLQAQNLWTYCRPTGVTKALLGGELHTQRASPKPREPTKAISQEPLLLSRAETLRGIPKPKPALVYRAGVTPRPKRSASQTSAWRTRGRNPGQGQGLHRLLRDNGSAYSMEPWRREGEGKEGYGSCARASWTRERFFS